MFDLLDATSIALLERTEAQAGYPPADWDRCADDYPDEMDVPSDWDPGFVNLGPWL